MHHIPANWPISFCGFWPHGYMQ